MDKRIFHIKNKLSQSLGSSRSVEDMASDVHMSAPQFRKLFREEVGETFTEYRHCKRLEKAREMLADPLCFLLIKEIGIEVGLTNESHFTQDFKAKFEMTPTEYRKQQAEIHQSLPPDGQE